MSQTIAIAIVFSSCINELYPHINLTIFNLLHRVGIAFFLFIVSFLCGHLCFSVVADMCFLSDVNWLRGFACCYGYSK